jgi:hypothetical protein
VKPAFNAQKLQWTIRLNSTRWRPKLMTNPTFTPVDTNSFVE